MPRLSIDSTNNESLDKQLHRIGQMLAYGGQTYVVAGLPPANADLKYARAWVSDAAASPVFGATATGGGSLTIPVWCDGTNWKNG